MDDCWIHFVWRTTIEYYIMISCMGDEYDIGPYVYLLLIVVFYQMSVPFLLDGLQRNCYHKNHNIWNTVYWCRNTGVGSSLYYRCYILKRYIVWWYLWWGVIEMRSLSIEWRRINIGRVVEDRTLHAYWGRGALIWRDKVLGSVSQIQ